MDAFVVEKRLDLLSNPHVVTEIVAAYVGRCYDPITSQLPHMELMNSKHTIDLSTINTNKQQSIQTNSTIYMSTTYIDSSSDHP